MNDDTAHPFEKLWNYAEPAATEMAFREYLRANAPPDAERAEVLTQISRACCLQRHHAEARAALDEALPLLPLGDPASRSCFAERSLPAGRQRTRDPRRQDRRHGSDQVRIADGEVPRAYVEPIAPELAAFAHHRRSLRLRACRQQDALLAPIESAGLRPALSGRRYLRHRDEARPRAFRRGRLAGHSWRSWPTLRLVGPRTL